MANRTCDICEVLLERAFEMIDQKGWDAFELRDLVGGDVSVQDVSACFKDKGALLEVFSKTIGIRLAQTPFSFTQDESIEERLFEIIMARLDLLAPYKKACQRIVETHLSSPLEAASYLFGLQEQVSVMLDLTGKRSFPPLFVTAMLVVFAGTLAKWSMDTDPEMNATMAFTHKALSTVCDFYNANAAK